MLMAVTKTLKKGDKAGLITYSDKIGTMLAELFTYQIAKESTKQKKLLMISLVRNHLGKEAGDKLQAKLIQDQPSTRRSSICSDQQEKKDDGKKQTQILETEDSDTMDEDDEGNQDATYSPGNESSKGKKGPRKSRRKAGKKKQ